MNYYIYGFTDKGNYRSNNEDCMLINRETVNKGGFGSVCIAPFLSAVCDGVGGEQAGEIASELCVRHLSVTDYDSTVDLDRRIMQIHNSIVKRGIKSSSSVNMQTTLCCLAVDESGLASCYNVGDSRMYRYVNGCVRQVSTDQTYGRFLYDKGAIDKLNQLPDSVKNAIISSVGSVVQLPTIEHVDFAAPFGREEDDTVLLCSDGFSDFVSCDEIEITMKLDDLTFKERIDALCRLAIRNGSTDNISVIGIKPWKTTEEYDRLTGSKAPDSKRIETAVADSQRIASREHSINDQLAQAAEDSLAKLFADLEKFRSE